MKSFFKEFSKIFITIILLYLLFRKIPAGDVFRIIRKMDLRYLYLSIGLIFLYYGFFAIRWRFLLQSQDIDLKPGRSFLYILISFFFNNFLPSGLGMDAVRSAYAGGKKNFEKAFGASLMERILGISGMMVIGLFSIFSLKSEFARFGVLYLFIIFLIGSIYFLMVSLKWRWLKDKLLSIKFLNLGESLRNVYKALKIYSKKKKVILAGLGYSILVQMAIIWINFFLARGLSMKIPFIVFVAYIPLITVISLIPITINGLGMRESAYVFLFSSYGVMQKEALSLSLLFFAASVVASSIGGILFLFVRKRQRTTEC